MELKIKNQYIKWCTICINVNNKLSGYAQSLFEILGIMPNN